LAARLEEALDGAVQVEALRHPGQADADLTQGTDLDAGGAATRIVGRVRSDRLHAGPLSVQPVRLVGPVGLAGLVFGLEPRPPVGPHLLDLARSDEARLDELAGIEVDDARMRADLLVHQGLREARLVALVVTEAAVAEHVDDDRLV